jgi:hypothetical protein
MIEFEQLTATDTRAPILINTDSIAHFEALVGASDRCRLVLKDGRQVVAAHSYAELRRLIIDARSGFATVLSR